MSKAIDWLEPYLKEQFKARVYKTFLLLLELNKQKSKNKVHEWSRCQYVRINFRMWRVPWTDFLSTIGWTLSISKLTRGFRNYCRGMKLACGPSNFDDNFDNSDFTFFIRRKFLFDNLQDQLLTPQLVEPTWFRDSMRIFLR